MIYSELLLIQFSYFFSTNLQAVPPMLSKSKTSLQTPQLQQPNSINCDNDLSGISRAKMRSVQQMVNKIQNKIRIKMSFFKNYVVTFKTYFL